MSKLLTLTALAALGLSATRLQEAPSGVHIPVSEILATYERAPEDRVSDQQIRHIDAGGHNVGVGLVRRPPTRTLGAIQHHAQTEVYLIMEGSGTLVTGGELTDRRDLDPEGIVVRTLTGPSSMGGIEGGVSQPVEEGDMVIIPAGAPHGFREITETITYLVVRVDPDQWVELKEAPGTGARQ